MKRSRCLYTHTLTIGAAGDTLKINFQRDDLVDWNERIENIKNEREIFKINVMH